MWIGKVSKGAVDRLAFGPDGTACAAGGTNKAFAVWDVDG